MSVLHEKLARRLAGEDVAGNIQICGDTLTVHRYGLLANGDIAGIKHLVVKEFGEVKNSVFRDLCSLAILPCGIVSGNVLLVTPDFQAPPNSENFYSNIIQRQD